MKKILLAAGLAAGAWAVQSCDTQKPQEISVGTQGIPYTLAKNYFINNNITTTVPEKIETAADFEKYFGMAAVMGKDGEPTKIDFTKQYVAVIDYGQTNKNVEITPQKVSAENGDILIDYTVKEGDTQSFTTRPFQALIIDKSNDGKVVLRKN